MFQSKWAYWPFVLALEVQSLDLICRIVFKITLQTVLTLKPSNSWREAFGEPTILHLVDFVGSRPVSNKVGLQAFCFVAFRAETGSTLEVHALDLICRIVTKSDSAHR